MKLRSSQEGGQKIRTARHGDGQEKRISRKEPWNMSNSTKKLGTKKENKGIGYSDLKVILVYGTIIYVVEWKEVTNGTGFKMEFAPRLQGDMYQTPK